jgi:hypothetical protein
MTAILSLCLLVAGLLVIVGLSVPAKKIAHAVLGILIIASLARCLSCQLRSRLSGIDTGSASGWFWTLAIILLVVTGGLAWKLRAYRARRGDELRRRHMHPRHPAPLPPPNPSDERWTS